MKVTLFGEIDGVIIKGHPYTSEDIIVVDDHIGTIGEVDFSNNICQLTMSFHPVAEAMKGRNYWVCSSHKASLEGLRYATEDEKRRYNELCGITATAHEEAEARRDALMRW